MSVSMIDGTLEAVNVKAKAGKLWRLDRLVFRKGDGSEEVLTGLTVVTPEVGSLLQPGISGRFYLYKSIDHRGLHAVRSSNGTVLMQFPSTNENLMAILFGINVLVVAAMMALDGQPSWLATALVPFTGVLYVLYRGTRVQAEAQVKADGS
jgi:hypothetical protein